MDFSNSMKDDLESLRDLAGNLTNEFAKVSENYRIDNKSFAHNLIKGNLQNVDYLDYRLLQHKIYFIPKYYRSKRIKGT